MARNVVAGGCLHRHNVANGQREIVDVGIVATVGIFEPHLHNVGRLIVGILSEPICFVEFITSGACLGREFAILGAKLATVTEREFTPATLGHTLGVGVQICVINQNILVFHSVIHF